MTDGGLVTDGIVVLGLFLAGAMMRGAPEHVLGALVIAAVLRLLSTTGDIAAARALYRGQPMAQKAVEVGAQRLLFVDMIAAIGLILVGMLARELSR